METVEVAPEQPPAEEAPEIEVADRGMSGVVVEQVEEAPHLARYDEVYLNGLTDAELGQLHTKTMESRDRAIENGKLVKQAQAELEKRRNRGEEVDPKVERDFEQKYHELEVETKDNHDAVKLIVSIIDRRERLKAENIIELIDRHGRDKGMGGPQEDPKDFQRCFLCAEVGHDYTNCPASRPRNPDFHVNVNVRQPGVNHASPFGQPGTSQTEIPYQGLYQTPGGMPYVPFVPGRERRAAPIMDGGRQDGRPLGTGGFANRAVPIFDTTKPPPVIGNNMSGVFLTPIVADTLGYPSGMVTPGRYVERNDQGMAKGQPFFASDTNPPRLIGVPYGRQNVSYINNPAGGSSYVKDYYVNEPRSDRTTRENDAKIFARKLIGDDATEEELKAAGNIMVSLVDNIRGTKGERRNTHEVKKIEKSFEQYTDRSLKKGIDFDELERQLNGGFTPKLSSLLPKNLYGISPSAAAGCMHSLCTSVMTDPWKPEIVRRYFAEQRDDINLVVADEQSKEVFIRELRVRQQDEERPMTAAQTQFNIKCPRMGAYTNVIREDLERIRHAKLGEWKMYSTDQKQNGLWALSTAHSVIDQTYNEQGAYRVLTQIFSGQPLDTINLVWNDENMGKDFPHVWSELIHLLSGACAYAMHKNGDKDIEKLLNTPPYDGIVKRIFDLRQARKNYNQSQGLFADDREASITNEHRLDVLGYVADYYKEYYPSVERCYLEDLKRKKDIKRDDPSFKFDPNVVLRNAVTKVISPRTPWSHPTRKRARQADGTTPKAAVAKNPYIDNRFVTEAQEGGGEQRFPAIEYKGTRQSRPQTQGTGERVVRGILTRNSRPARALSPAMAAIDENLRERLRQTDFRARCYLCKTKGHDYPNCKLYPDMIPSGPECRECGGFHGFVTCQAKNADIDVKMVVEADEMELDEAIESDRRNAEAEQGVHERRLTSEELAAREEAL